MVQTFYIGPVLLGFGSRAVGARRRGALATIAIGRVEVYVARERTRQNLADVALITGDEGAIR